MDAHATPIANDAPQQSKRAPLSERIALSPAEAGRLLGLGRTAMYAAVKSGVITHVKIGGRILIPVAPLLTMLEGKPEAVKLRAVG